MLAEDRKRLRCIDSCCREIILRVRENEEDYARFVENKAARKSVFSQLNGISSMVCGLSPQMLDLFKQNGFRENYLVSLRFWVPDAEKGDDRMWRVVWDIAANDCMELLLFVAELLEQKS